MTLPDVDTISTAGGALNDYSAVIDSTTDRPAAGANTAYCNQAMSTHTLTRCLTRFAPAGTGTPVLASSGKQYDAVWLTATGTAPVVARSTTGTYTITWPSTVNDEIPSNSPGATSGGHSVNLVTGWGNAELGSTTPYLVFVTCSSNVITVKIYSVGSSPALTDPNDGSVFCIYAR